MLLTRAGGWFVSAGGGANIGTPVVIGYNENTGGINSTTVDAPIGSLVVVFVGGWSASNGTSSSLTDSVGNTYTLAVQPAAVASCSYPCVIYYSSNIANDIPVGSSFTETNSGGVSKITIAVKVSGANGGNDSGASQSDNSPSTSSFNLSTGTLASSNEIVFGGLGTTAVIGGLTLPSGFTELNATDPAGLSFSYKIVNSNASVTWNPSFNTVVMSTALASFKAG